ncbi:MAG: outer membrane beta-barrel family protein [Paramuribaculum sp.]|nr:outer membrane beta-barrel family protein [Paramuribaculum sp.]
MKKFIISLALLLPSLAYAQQEVATDSLTRQLEEVVVTARQPATKLAGTTLVSTIAGSNLANLGNALDVLAQLPMICVEDNAVSVTGKSNLEIYIDGRPMHDEQELRQILSSNLSKVELLMAPGAAYGSTTGAVLKITTKRNFAQGLSLTDQLQLQRRRRGSVMDYLALNYRLDAWDIYINGTFNHNDNVIKGATINTLNYEGKKTIVGSSQYNRFPSSTGVVRSGFNYSQDNQSFGAYYRYNPERGNFTNTGAEWLDNEIPIARIINNDTQAHSNLVSIYYHNTFADKYLLHFDGDYSRSVADHSVATTYPDATYDDVMSADSRHSTLWAGKLYLNFPLAKGDFTVGTQDSYTHTSLDYRMLNATVGQYIPSSFTDARQTSASIFATWARMFGKLNMSIGARYEYVDYDFTVDEKRDDDISRRDHLLTPDFSLGYSFNAHTQISLSYKMATVKPPYSQLTGSLSYVGLHEIEGGNPSLNDERMHDLQLFGMWRNFMIQTDLTRSINTYAYVKQLYPAHNLQLLMHPINIDVTALSMYIVWSKPIRRWTPNMTLGLYRQWLDIAGTNYNRPIFSYYLDNSFALPRGWNATVNINGQGRGDMHTNQFGTTRFAIDASIGKTLLNKALTLRLSATDIFNTANNDWKMNTFGISVDKRQKYDRRGVSLNVIYQLNPQKSKYKGTTASEAEMQRL